MGFDPELTQQILGDIGPLRFNPKVVKVCQQCGKQDFVRYKGRKKPTDDYYCRKCVVNRPEVKRKQSEITKKQWENQEFRELVVTNSKAIWNNQDLVKRMSKVRTDKKCILALIQRNKERIYDSAKISNRMQELWDNPDYRKKMVKIRKAITAKLWTTDEYRAKQLATMNKRWANPEYRAMISTAAKAKWQDPEYAERVLAGLRKPETIAKIRAHSIKCWESPKYREKVARVCVSRIQEQLYSTLDDLNVEYFRERQDEDDDNECKIGPYSFDCVIPSTPKKLLIECQGDYWHSLDVIKSRDKAKAAYITNNLANEYEIRYIWEHEFKNLNKVQELLKYWLGLSTPEICDFSFNDVTIAKAEASDYKLLLSKYHYLANAGRGGISIGGYVDGELACVAVFSPLPRQNITIGEYKASEVRDLSRFCINPKYQKKNFGTWFLSRAIKMLSPEYRCIVAYADTTFNHSGAIYKAANFTLDKVVRPDYWYVSEDGWVMHKKTLYNHAVSLGMIESEFAAENEYTKVWGKEKLRFVFNR